MLGVPNPSADFTFDPIGTKVIDKLTGKPAGNVPRGTLAPSHVPRGTLVPSHVPGAPPAPPPEDGSLFERELIAGSGVKVKHAAGYAALLAVVLAIGRR